MLGFFTCRQRGGTDPMVAALARRLQQAGLHLAGAVQENIERPGRRHCHMELHVLAGTRRVRISQDLGEHARGCRLDPDGLERAAAMVAGALDARVDLLIVNKFGKQECDGRGFLPVIGEALSQGVPVLVSVSDANRAAFLQIADGMAEELAPEPEALFAWARARVRDRAA
ncbi:DUF2478 domain-containing protein [Roseivivax isoporae]|uniref:3-dehydroquinate dehydratase n=1 Tax=Roseivivax isoporae LMG 25204 TaxID=1449351 RepID=X7FC41_9RHOB|nr:DUF2478 domain-containing protein [Roseivivax isoporae]ETX30313.1 3-dehydroquinate dehydratase [Roseivivax isoporae LMG 25204]